MRGTTVTNMLAMLNNEVGNSGAANTSRDAQYIVAMSNMQKKLAVEYEWPFLEQRWDQVVPANTQFMTFPTSATGDGGAETTSFDLNRMPLVEVKWTNKWNPVMYGIGAKEYNSLDFSLNQQSDPIQKWRVASNVGEVVNPNEYEVWPVPVTNQTLRFTAMRTLLPMAQGTDICDLDDMLIVLFTAARILKRNKSADWQDAQREAQRYFTMLKQNQPTEDTPRRCLGGDYDSEKKKLVGMVIVK